jgi:hypothetical protein
MLARTANEAPTEAFELDTVSRTIWFATGLSKRLPSGLHCDRTAQSLTHPSFNKQSGNDAASVPIGQCFENVALTVPSSEVAASVVDAT